MEWRQIIKNIINNKKWVKNDTGLWKIQCCKLFEDKEHLMLIIVTDELNGPALARVNKIVSINNNREIVLFYDNVYNLPLDEKEYDKYSDVLSKQEWEILFSGEAVKHLYEMDAISEENGFYIEPHETMEKFTREAENYNEILSDEISSSFNL